MSYNILYNIIQSYLFFETLIHDNITLKFKQFFFSEVLLICANDAVATL